MHQVQYAELLLEEHASHIPLRARTTAGEAGKLQGGAESITVARPEQPRLRMDQVRTKIMGALLWPSTRARPDLSCAESLASQALSKDFKKKDRLRHLLQYLKSTKSQGLLYAIPSWTSNKLSLSEFTVYSDSSFAPAGKNSQIGIAIFLTYGTVRHDPLAIVQTE